MLGPKVDAISSRNAAGKTLNPKRFCVPPEPCESVALKVLEPEFRIHPSHESP